MTIVVILTQNHHGPFLHRNPIPDNPRFQTSTEHLVLLSSSGSNHPRHLHCPGSALPRAFAFHLYSCLHARFRYYFILLHLSREARLALERWCPSIKPALISEKHNGGHRVKLGGALLLPIPLHELLEKITCISNHSLFSPKKSKTKVSEKRPATTADSNWEIPTYCHATGGQEEWYLLRHWVQITLNTDTFLIILEI